MVNVAEDAGPLYEDDDCTLIEHFRPVNFQKGTTEYWVFGYFYTNLNQYFCSNRGGIEGGLGTRPGETNSIDTLRLICPCRTGMYSIDDVNHRYISIF